MNFWSLNLRFKKCVLYQIFNKNFEKRARNFFRKLKIFLDILIKLKILRHRVLSVLKNIEKQKKFYIYTLNVACLWTVLLKGSFPIGGGDQIPTLTRVKTGF